jgi:AcrR family transcriptional regulator
VNTVHMVRRRVAKSSPKAVTRSHARAFARGIDDTRTLLVAVARDVFLEAGPASFSLREVARRVGISAAAVYRHFEGKEALLFAACTQGFQLFSSYLVRALGEPTPLARLLKTGDLYRLFALENPLDYRFIFMSPAGKLTPPLARAKAPSKGALPQDTTFRFLVDRVRECMAVGVLATDDAERSAVVIWAHVHGVVSLRLSGHLGALGDSDAFAVFYRASVERLLGARAP